MEKTLNYSQIKEIKVTRNIIYNTFLNNIVFIYDSIVCDNKMFSYCDITTQF